MAMDNRNVPPQYANTWRALTNGATRGVANRVNEARFATSPIGLVVSFNCATYGTRPPGSRLGTRHWTSTEIEPNSRLEERSRSIQKNPSRHFDVRERRVVHQSFQATCARLKCELDALNVRSEHLHLVCWLPPGLTPAEFMRAGKADATAQLRSVGSNVESVWARSYVPSILYSIAGWFRAVRYALCEQGENDYLPFPQARPYDNLALVAKRRRYFSDLQQAALELSEQCN